MKNIKHQNISRITLFLISLFWVTKLVAQDISFNYLSTENGLSQFTAYCLYKDELGRIWIGTHDGLNVYNGNWVRSYKPERGNEHSIVGKDVRRICGDGKGHLYIQTIEGICIFDMYSETFETIQKGPGHSITYSSDTLLIGGNGSVYYYDVLNHQVKPYCSLEGDIQVSSLLKDKTGRLWLGTRGDGLYCLKKGEMKQLCVLPQCNVFNLYQDSSGDIWVCTWEDGLYHISDNGTVHYTDG